MSLRYRKSIKLPLGFRVNLSSKGAGISWGVKGYRKSISPSGQVRTTYSIPGTGISYVKNEGNAAKRRETDDSIRYALRLEDNLFYIRTKNSIEAIWKDQGIPYLWKTFEGANKAAFRISKLDGLHKGKDIYIATMRIIDDENPS